MRRDLFKRLEALETARKPLRALSGLGHFYNTLSNKERERAIAHLYPKDQPAKGTH